MNLERRQDETPLEYHRRIIYGKLVDKTLGDVDYSELSELAYGQPYSSDVARRMFYGSKRTLDLIDEAAVSNASCDSLLSELDEKVIELRKERQKFYDQRREYSKILTAEARNEHVYSELVKAANRLDTTVGALYTEHDKYSIDYQSGDAVLILSDWHYGLKTENVFNRYDTDICKRRIAWVAGLAKARIMLHKCRKLHIVILGDLYHGAIHTSARVASEELVCDQLMQVSEILAQTIIELSRCVDTTYVYLTYGNHARTVQNKNDSIHRDNMERVIPWWLKERLSSYDDIAICEDTGNEFIVLNVNNHGVCCSHGDNDSVKSSPRLLHTLFHKKYGTDIEYILIGDKHHRESFEELGVTSILCGALCGADDYANDKRLYSTPSQTLLIFNDDGLDAEYRLKCE